MSLSPSFPHPDVFNPLSKSPMARYKLPVGTVQVATKFPMGPVVVNILLDIKQDAASVKVDITSRVDLLLTNECDYLLL